MLYNIIRVLILENNPNDVTLIFNELRKSGYGVEWDTVKNNKILDQEN